MKCVVLTAFAFFALCAFLVQDTRAATAIVIAPKGTRHMFASPGDTPSAWLGQMPSNWGRINPILIQSTNTVGFGAAAIWRHGEDWTLGVALGWRSPQEAQDDVH